MSDPPRIALLLHPIPGYYRQLLEGIARYAQIHGPWMFCLAGEHAGLPMPYLESIPGMLPRVQRYSSEKSLLRALTRLDAKGVIGRIQTRPTTRALLSCGLPVIALDLTEEQRAINNPLSRLSEVCVDAAGIGRIAAEHLLERGFTSLGFCGCDGRSWSDQRQHAFSNRAEESHCSCQVYQPPARSHTLPWHRERSHIAAWLRSLPTPAGVMACNDIRGRQVIEACTEAGLRVPDDVAVVGVDEDRLMCELANPPLSSVAINLVGAGYRGAELLDGLMSGRVCRPQRILAEAMWVTPRRSTDVLASEDRHVAAALRFIRDHFRQPITVSDVVAESHISRRTLEMRFQRILKRSVHQQIQEARLTWSKKLLGETALSAGRIAELSGFGRLNYMSSVFRRELAMTVTEYRRRFRNP